MHYSDHRKQTIARGIFHMWWNWTFSVGMIAILVVSAPVLTPKLVPLLALFFELVLLILDRRNRFSLSPVPFRIPYIVQSALFFSAIVLIITIPMLSREGAVEWNGQPINPDNPMIPILLTSPVFVIVTIYYLVRMQRPAYRKKSHLRNADSVDRGVLGMFFGKETSYQVKMLLTLSVTLTFVTWIYYFMFYYNNEINRTDRYFFIWIPITTYLLSLVYLGSRYYNLWIYYCKNPDTDKVSHHSGTSLRYIIVNNGMIFIGQPNNDPHPVTVEDLKADTPLVVDMEFRENITLDEAKSVFREKTGIDDAFVRELYSSHDHGMYHTVFHYMAFVDDKKKIEKLFVGEWITLMQFVEMSGAHIVKTQLAAEIYRVYTMTMAWKTYDERGYRRYPIRHYRPTFRLADMPSWDIDYNDRRWLYVSDLNQDSPLFCLRRLWNRIIKGF